MKIVIVGYGRVGTRTTNILTSEGHEVVIIEADPEKAQRARDDGLETFPILPIARPTFPPHPSCVGPATADGGRVP